LLLLKPQLREAGLDNLTTH